MATTQKIIPNFWFSHNAEEAVAFYTSVFPDSSIGKIMRYGSEGFEIHKMPEGTVMTIEFSLMGQNFTALNGGPIFKFNESVSFIVDCQTQEEVDNYWYKLSEGGDPNAQQCGWLKDKFGLSWQIVPSVLNELMADDDEKKSAAVMRAMLQMKKLDVAALQSAYDAA